MLRSKYYINHFLTSLQSQGAHRSAMTGSARAIIRSSTSSERSDVSKRSVDPWALPDTLSMGSQWTGQYERCTQCTRKGFLNLDGQNMYMVKRNSIHQKGCPKQNGYDGF